MTTKCRCVNKNEVRYFHNHQTIHFAFHNFRIRVKVLVKTQARVQLSRQVKVQHLVNRELIAVLSLYNHSHLQRPDEPDPRKMPGNLIWRQNR